MGERGSGIFFARGLDRADQVESAREIGVWARVEFARDGPMQRLREYHERRPRLSFATVADKRKLSEKGFVVPTRVGGPETAAGQQYLRLSGPDEK